MEEIYNKKMTLGLCKECKNDFRKKYSKQLFCGLFCSSRFNLNNKHRALLPDTYSEPLAELFGILLGDGSVTKYFLKIYLNLKVEKEYAVFVQQLLRGLFPNVPVTAYERPLRGTIDIQVSSKDVCDYLRSVGFSPKERFVPDWIIKRDLFVRATLRGLFDTEGSVGIKFFDGKRGGRMYKQLTFTNKNKNLLEFVEQKLSERGFSPTKNSTKNIYVSNKEDIASYFKNIGSSNSKLTKGLRTEKIGAYSY